MARRKKIAPLGDARPGQQFTLEEVVEILRTFNVITEAEQPAQVTERHDEAPGIAPEANKLYTVEEAAGRLRIGRTTIYELIREGELDSVQIGRRRLIPVEAVDAFLSSVVRRRSSAA
ncbi:helix-turn-helix domain-containing protein [Actinomadura rayongensis]|uniref:Excisionase family DNA-binding protein n=1 Tax=Actinomadura rayongensis TaxID=1429076 RepID=A0A6I4WGD6_9ACTN|nr:helix-turn-helix domain-containing protein [Actinomadura rayongensis]MXQ65652.1 excisionase family DNA-binding protein [Actinomadura rayongensis]